MVNLSVFEKSVKATVIPNELGGISLALFLMENPNKIYKKKDTYYTYCQVNEKFLYCKPTNHKCIYWYSANGLESTFNNYIRNVKNYRLLYQEYRDKYLEAKVKLQKYEQFYNGVKTLVNDDDAMVISCYQLPF